MPERLDDPGFVLRNDPRGMMGLTEGFPDQCREALSLCAGVRLGDVPKAAEQIVVGGMGGSAVGGDFLKALVHEHGSVPCFVCRDYRVPSFVGKGTLFLACSYSGDTEETLSASQLALEKGASLIAITSGGALANLAQQKGFPIVRIPAGQPPRTALGYLFLPLVVICEKLGYLQEIDFGETIDVLDSCRKDWCIASSYKLNPTKGIATYLFARIPLVYGLGEWQSSVAFRWKAQINENAKVMAFANAFPELNHNEIVGWTLADRQAEKWATVILEDGEESNRMQKRAEVMQDIIRGKSEVFTVTARGQSLLSKLLTLSYFGDFVSLYLAALYGVDPEKIDSIHQLKKALSEMN